MTHITLRLGNVQPNRLNAVFEWLRQAKVAASLPQQDVEDLSDRQLRDIGAHRQDVSRALDREVGRLGLLDIGWQRSKR